MDLKNKLSDDELKILADLKYKEQKSSYGRISCKKKRYTTDEIRYARLCTQLYSKRVALSMDNRLTQLNLNTIVLGGSGSGKSRYFVKPNILQANSSIVVTDPSGELLMSCGKFLEEQGYVVKVFNIEDMSNSMRYNPFAYVHEDADIPLMVDTIVSNLEGMVKPKGANIFWDEALRTLLIAICGYLFETQPMEKRNFTNVARLLELMDVDENSEAEKDELDKLFDDLEEADPTSYAVSNYKVIKSAGRGETAQNISITTLSKISRFFNLKKIANLTYKDELNLDEIGQRKCALFVITPQANTTYNFLAAALYTQLFDLLYKQGVKNAKRRRTTCVEVDMPVRFLIDEAGNIGTIPRLENVMSTCRKYNISISLIYQNMAQVQTLFEKKWEILVGNCDTMLFLGDIDPSTVKLISERLGKQTINTINTSKTTGNKGSGSKSKQSIGRNLMFTSEIEQMDNDKCIVFIRSMKPYMDFKYPLERHQNYKKSGDYSDKNMYFLDNEIIFDQRAMLAMTVPLQDQAEYIHPRNIVSCDHHNPQKERSSTRSEQDKQNQYMEPSEIMPVGDTYSYPIYEVIEHLKQSHNSLSDIITICEGYDGH